MQTNKEQKSGRQRRARGSEHNIARTAEVGFPSAFAKDKALGTARSMGDKAQTGLELKNAHYKKYFFALKTLISVLSTLMNRDLTLTPLALLCTDRLALHLNISTIFTSSLQTDKPYRNAQKWKVFYCTKQIFSADSDILFVCGVKHKSNSHIWISCKQNVWWIPLT